jgi:two-component system chemotaxis response regulator CheB
MMEGGLNPGGEAAREVEAARLFGLAPGASVNPLYCHRFVVDAGMARPGLRFDRAEAVVPGDKPLGLASTGVLGLNSERPRASQWPSADVLFDSMARVAKAKAIGVILTGMGEDGAIGLLEMKKAGACTITEDKSTCVVSGMPAAALRTGEAVQSLPIDLVAGRASLLVADTA